MENHHVDIFEPQFLKRFPERPFRVAVLRGVELRLDENRFAGDPGANGFAHRPSDLALIFVEGRRIDETDAAIEGRSHGAHAGLAPERPGSKTHDRHRETVVERQILHGFLPNIRFRRDEPRLCHNDSHRNQDRKKPYP